MVVKTKTFWDGKKFHKVDLKKRSLRLYRFD